MHANVPEDLDQEFKFPGTKSKSANLQSDENAHAVDDGALAKFERAMILKRQREWTARTKAAGKPTERPERLKPVDVKAIKVCITNRESKASLSAEYKVARGTCTWH